MIAAAREFGLLPHEYAARTSHRQHQAYVEWLRANVWPERPESKEAENERKEPSAEYVRNVSAVARGHAMARFGLLEEPHGG